MGFVDWNPKPPDHNMGLFRPVKVHFHKAVAVENVFVASQIDHATWSQAELTVSADLANHSTNVVETTLQGVIGAVLVSEKFTLQPLETRTVKLTAADHPECEVRGAKVVVAVGTRRAKSLHREIDCEDWRRHFRCAISPLRHPRGGGLHQPGRLSRLHGERQKILIRGGGWADELLLRETQENLAAQVHYTKAMNLNTIRLEGVWGSSQRLYDPRG